jgi:hypothetical protein
VLRLYRIAAIFCSEKYQFWGGVMPKMLLKESDQEYVVRPPRSEDLMSGLKARAWMSICSNAWKAPNIGQAFGMGWNLMGDLCAR